MPAAPEDTPVLRAISTLGVWAVRANAPANVGTGGALAYDGSRYIYAFAGGNSRSFWRYDTATQSWDTVFNNNNNNRAPANVGAGGALAYDGSGYIYALRGGGNRNDFWRFNLATQSWESPPTFNRPAPGTVGSGGALAYDGSRYIYAFRGNNQMGFWRYDTTLNSWDSTSLQAAPANVDAGGALAYADSGYIYALRGNGTSAFWRYDIIGNYWTSMANALGNVADGGALTFVAVNTYVGLATMASQVRDTGISGDRWDALIWDETLPANTDITFEVRASDTLFARDAATPAWTPVGGTSPITSGLPSGRYMQWRATLTTSDTSVTPVLHEVRLYHY